jgi:hypothetical protein
MADLVVNQSIVSVPGPQPTRRYSFTPADLNAITHALQIAQNECAREQANHLKSGNVTMARFHKERVDTFTKLLKRFM